MSRKMKNTLVLTAVALVLVALALPKIGSREEATNGRSNAGAGRDQRLAVRVQPIQPERRGDKVVTVGTILPNEKVEVRTEISGKIDRILFKEGGRIRKGETLIKINDAELQAQFLRAQYRQAQAEQLEKRQRQMFERNLISQEEYDTVFNNLNVMKAEVQLIKAQIDKTEIRAPFDGVIGLRFVSEGSYLSPNTNITTLQDNNTVKIDFKVPEKYAQDIKTGDKIQFTVHGKPREFTGTVYARDTQIDPSTRTLHLLARSPNPDGALLPGAFANIQLVLKEKEALMIPAEAVVPELKGHKIFLYKGGEAVSQKVEIGLRTDEAVEITQGVQPGDTLITSAILQLRPGLAVRPAER